MAQTTVLGVDIGGTKIACGIIDAATGDVLLSARVPTRASEGGIAVLQRSLEVARDLLEQSKAQDVKKPSAIGIGAGGQIDPVSGVVLSATDVLPGWAGIRIKDAFEGVFGLPSTVDNDVNALAVGESRFGAGKGMSNLIYLALGTGVGGALLMEGRVYHSHTGVSGELGHLMLFPDGLPCTCGGRGCLEQYTCGPALWRRFTELGGKSVDGNGPSLLEQAAANPTGPAARAVADVGYYLGLGLVSLANIFGPDKFIIGGGVASIGYMLLTPARRTLAERALPLVRNIPVVGTGLGDDAPLIGAASLVL